MGTRFVGTYECDASNTFKKVLINASKDDIKLLKSPVGYPARGIITKLIKDIEKGEENTIQVFFSAVQMDTELKDWYTSKI